MSQGVFAVATGTINNAGINTTDGNNLDDLFGVVKAADSLGAGVFQAGGKYEKFGNVMSMQGRQIAVMNFATSSLELFRGKLIQGWNTATDIFKNVKKISFLMAHTLLAYDVFDGLGVTGWLSDKLHLGCVAAKMGSFPLIERTSTVIKGCLPATFTVATVGYSFMSVFYCFSFFEACSELKKATASTDKLPLYMTIGISAAKTMLCALPIFGVPCLGVFLAVELLAGLATLGKTAYISYQKYKADVKKEEEAKKEKEIEAAKQKSDDKQALAIEAPQPGSENAETSNKMAGASSGQKCCTTDGSEAQPTQIPPAASTTTTSGSADKTTDQTKETVAATAVPKVEASEEGESGATDPEYGQVAFESLALPNLGCGPVAFLAAATCDIALHPNGGGIERKSDTGQILQNVRNQSFSVGQLLTSWLFFDSLERDFAKNPKMSFEYLRTNWRKELLNVVNKVVKLIARAFTLISYLDGVGLLVIGNPLIKLVGKRISLVSATISAYARMVTMNEEKSTKGMSKWRKEAAEAKSADNKAGLIYDTCKIAQSVLFNDVQCPLFEKTTISATTHDSLSYAALQGVTSVSACARSVAGNWEAASRERAEYIEKNEKKKRKVANLSAAAA